MARKKKSSNRKSALPSRWCGGGGARQTGMAISAENDGNRCAELLQILVRSGHAEDDLLPVAFFEEVISEFAAEMAKRIPVQYHPDLLEAVENFSRRLMAADS